MGKLLQTPPCTPKYEHLITPNSQSPTPPSLPKLLTGGGGGNTWLSHSVFLHPQDHFALRPQKRGGLLGTGGKGMKEWRLELEYRPKETMDHRQNNGSVKAVSPRHCPATCALCNSCFNCCAWAESQKQCPLHCCWRTTWTTRSERGPTFTAQLHLPTHDLFWVNLKVQLHLPPSSKISWSFDLAWNLDSPSLLAFMLLCVHGGGMTY